MRLALLLLLLGPLTCAGATVDLPAADQSGVRRQVLSGASVVESPAVATPVPLPPALPAGLALIAGLAYLRHRRRPARFV